MIVKLANWSDKMLLLRRGREPLRSLGIKIAGDLTKLQSAKIQELRNQGKTAYYRGSQLVVEDGYARGARGDNRGLDRHLGEVRGRWSREEHSGKHGPHRPRNHRFTLPREDSRWTGNGNAL